MAVAKNCDSARNARIVDAPSKVSPKWENTGERVTDSRRSSSRLVGTYMTMILRYTRAMGTQATKNQGTYR